MAPQGKNSNAVVLAGIGVSIGLATAAIFKKPAAASGNNLVLDEATANLLIAIANGVQISAADLELIKESLVSQTGGNLQITPAIADLIIPPNGNDVINEIVTNNTAGVNNAVQLPGINIPKTFSVSIKSLPTNPAGSFVWIGKSKATIIGGRGWPLIQNEAVHYRIDNTDRLFMAVSNAGMGIAITVEQLPII